MEFVINIKKKQFFKKQFVRVSMDKEKKKKQTSKNRQLLNFLDLQLHGKNNIKNKIHSL